MAWEELVDYVVPSNTGQVDFTGLNITKDDFIKIVYTRVQTGSGTPTEIIRVNDNTSSNYPTQWLNANGSVVDGQRYNDSGLLIGGSLANSSGLSFAYLKISENNKVNMFTNANYNLGSLTRVLYQYTTTTFDASTITKLSLNQASGANPINPGSRIQIYKLVAEKVADVVVNANTTQVDITGLDIKKGDEYLLVSENKRIDSGSITKIIPNDLSTSTQYYTQRIIGNGSSALASRSNDNFAIVQGNPGPTISYTHIKVSNIGAFTLQTYCLMNSGSNLLQIQNSFLSSTYENLANIIKLTFVRDSGNVEAESRFELYKLYEGGN